MNLSQIPFLIQESWRGFWHHRQSTWPVLITVFFASFLWMLCASVLVGIKWGHSNESPLSEIRIFIKAETPDSLLPQITQTLQSQYPEFRLRSYTHSQALQEFKQKFGDEYLSELDTNPLPSSIALHLSDHWIQSDKIDQLIPQLQSLTFVENTNNPAPLLRELESKKNHLLMLVTILISIVIFALWLILSNAVRLSLIARKNLVENLNMIGASFSFILLPFALESLIQSLIASSLAFTLCYVLIQKISGLGEFSLPLNTLYLSWMGMIALSLLISFFVTWKTLMGFLWKRETE